MLKGCHKSIVFLKNTGSELFDEAYFIVKPNTHPYDDKDIVREATCLVNGYLEQKQKKKGHGWIFSFLIGALLGFSLMLGLHFIF